MATIKELGTDLKLSQRASDYVAQMFVDEGWFTIRQDAAIFAAAYVLKYHFKDFDPGSYVVPDQLGTNYAYGNLDKGGYWENLIRNLYQTETPRLFFRNLMIYGLEEIGNDIERLGVLQIENYI
ncbi:hypothetical protein [Clostridium sp. KNHs216]|uniref:hypothetical protein n=1 Tax=Clostridium sp. KNHs216 TaxID=1550235 RepID=UPI00114E7106|nr:hypothetical protein [Clostridium sp. KNHs216]TQI67887.1 hypothetical protein LY85_2599 [Clostridium sp. KNHs216]